MNKDQFIFHCKENYSSIETVPSDLISSLDIKDYSDVRDILMHNVCVNYMMFKSGMFSEFLSKTINGDSIGLLLSDDNVLFDSLCKGWIFDKNLMEYANEDQIDKCAKHWIEQSEKNLSYEISDGNEFTFFEYVIDTLKKEYKGNVLKVVLNKCANLILSDISRRVEEYK